MGFFYLLFENCMLCLKFLCSLICVENYFKVLYLYLEIFICQIGPLYRICIEFIVFLKIDVSIRQSYCSLADLHPVFCIM